MVHYQRSIPPDAIYTSREAPNHLSEISKKTFRQRSELSSAYGALGDAAPGGEEQGPGLGLGKDDARQGPALGQEFEEVGEVPVLAVKEGAHSTSTLGSP
jgi:hypothetical protein